MFTVTCACFPQTGVMTCITKCTPQLIMQQFTLIPTYPSAVCNYCGYSVAIHRQSRRWIHREQDIISARWVWWWALLHPFYRTRFTKAVWQSAKPFLGTTRKETNSYACNTLKCVTHYININRRNATFRHSSPAHCKGLQQTNNPCQTAENVLQFSNRAGMFYSFYSYPAWVDDGFATVRVTVSYEVVASTPYHTYICTIGAK